MNSQNLPRIFLRNLHVNLVMFLALGDSPTSGWAGQLCSVTPGVTNPQKAGKSAKVTPDLKHKGLKGPRWFDLAENQQALLSPFPLNLTGKGRMKPIPFPCPSLRQTGPSQCPGHHLAGGTMGSHRTWTGCAGSSRAPELLRTAGLWRDKGSELPSCEELQHIQGLEHFWSVKRELPKR